MHPWQLFGLFNTHSRRFSAILQPSPVWAHPPSSSAHNHPETIGFWGAVVVAHRKEEGFAPFSTPSASSAKQHETHIIVYWVASQFSSQPALEYVPFLPAFQLSMCMYRSSWFPCRALAEPSFAIKFNYILRLSTFLVQRTTATSKALFWFFCQVRHMFILQCNSASNWNCFSDKVINMAMKNY